MWESLGDCEAVENFSSPRNRRIADLAARAIPFSRESDSQERLAGESRRASEIRHRDDRASRIPLLYGLLLYAANAFASFYADVKLAPGDASWTRRIGINVRPAV